MMGDVPFGARLGGAERGISEAQGSQDHHERTGNVRLGDGEAGRTVHLISLN